MATRIGTRTICPAELDQARPAKPIAVDGATVTANAAGADWLRLFTGWADGVAKLFDDAQTACRHEAGS